MEFSNYFEQKVIRVVGHLVEQYTHSAVVRIYNEKDQPVKSIGLRRVKPGEKIVVHVPHRLRTARWARLHAFDKDRMEIYRTDRLATRSGYQIVYNIPTQYDVRFEN